MNALRHFYRCADCLTVAVAVEYIEPTRDTRGYPQWAICDGCGGHVEYMGPVNRHRQIFRTEFQCPCDGRCTGAIGPSCDCSCGGENHGTGAMVEVLKSVEGLPRIMTPKDAAVKAEIYRGLVVTFRAAWDARYGCATREKRAGYVTPATYRTYMEGQEVIRAFSKARSIRTHTGRNKRIIALTESLGRTVAA